MHTHTCTHTAYFNDLVVGGVCCRVETEGDKHRMYIMTLGCLAPYRRLGVGTLLGYITRVTDHLRDVHPTVMH